MDAACAPSKVRRVSKAPDALAVAAACAMHDCAPETAEKDAEQTVVHDVPTDLVPDAVLK